MSFRQARSEVAPTRPHRLSSLLLAAAVSALLLQACGLSNSFRKIDTTGGSGLITDIKTRTILVGEDVNGGPVRVCAEPSPDALSVAASEISLSSKRTNGSETGLTAAQQETAAYIGLRTQSIQLLRDSLYRLCEGYLSHALSAEDYTLLMRRAQRYMVALLAIEQLTGTVRASQPAVSVTSALPLDTEVSKYLLTRATELQGKMKVLEDTIIEKDKAIEATKEDARKPLQEERMQIVAELGLLAGEKKRVDSVLISAAGANVGSSIAPSDEDGANSGLPSTKGVTSAVADIVSRVLAADDYNTDCFHLLVRSTKQPVGSEGPRSKIAELCENQLAEITSEILHQRTLELKLAGPSESESDQNGGMPPSLRAPDVLIQRRDQLLEESIRRQQQGPIF